VTVPEKSQEEAVRRHVALAGNRLQVKERSYDLDRFPRILVAGALVDGATCRQARHLGLNPEKYLADNDSYNFFDRLGQLFKTGPTRTNVMDLICLLVDKRSSHW
jgi:hypothetical protein